MKRNTTHAQHNPQKRTRNLLIPCVLGMLCILSTAAYSEIRMINQTALLRAYGFSNGRYDSVEAMIYEVDPSIEVPVGHIEGNASLDSALEFFTAARYGSVRVSPSAQRVINRELPRGREGDLKLGAAWIERRFKGRTTIEACNRALAFISNRSGIGVAEFRRYFRRVVTRKLVAIARPLFPSGTPLPRTIQPLIDYVASFDSRGNLRVNDEALFNDLVRSARRYYDNDHSMYSAYVQTIYKIDVSLNERVHRYVSNNRGVR